MDIEKAEVDDAVFETLDNFSQAASATNITWLVVGATARILLLEQVYGLPRGLATQDIDFGVQVGDWEHYRLICDYLIQNCNTATERKPAKRFTSSQNIVFDLVPYGGVEDKNKQVFWPLHNDDVMTVRGFEGAAKSAKNIIVNDTLTVPVASPAGLCALKLFAWQERHTQHPGRDAKDIAYLFRHIESLYTAEQLHTEYSDAIEKADYALKSAGFYQLGCDVKTLLNSDDLKFMVEFIIKELNNKDDSRLCRELHKYSNMASIDEVVTALDFFNQGLCSI